MANKSKFATVVFSLLPGAGHMYLGRQQRGLLFMVAFFLSIFLTSWTGGLLLVGFLIPVIWFSSFFDALQCYDQNSTAQAEEFFAWDWLFKQQRWAGIALIALGTLILLNKLAYPVLVRYLDYWVIRTAGITLVALLLIAGGIRLVWGKPLSQPEWPGMEESGSDLPLQREEMAPPVELSQPPDNSRREESEQEEE